MTTTVTVKARAHGATVEVDGETTTLRPNSEQSFHVTEGTKSFSVTQPDQPPAESKDFVDEATGTSSGDVAGREQNDELLGKGGTRSTGSAPLRKGGAEPTGDNRSGAGEGDQQV